MPPETCGRPIWWDGLRPLHAGLYGLAGVAWLRGRRDLAGALVLSDAVLGLLAFGVHQGVRAR